MDYPTTYPRNADGSPLPLDANAVQFWLDFEAEGEDFDWFFGLLLDHD